MIAIIEAEDDFNEIVQSVLLENIEISNLVNSIDRKFRENESNLSNDEEIEC